MPEKALAHQRALVTGASSGIGAAVAKAFADAGAAVVVHYHSDAGSAQRLVDQITAGGGQAWALQADIGNPDACSTLVDAAADRMQGLDILVANAGIQRDGPVAELSLQAWQDVLNVNLTGHFLCAQQSVRRFRRQGLDANRSSALGKIIFVSSVHQHIPWAGHANYAAAKGGLKLLMETLAQEVAPEKIRVNALAPGAIRTPINRAAWETESALGDLLRLIPLGRIGKPEDVARAAVWLASDASDYVVGATLVVDGGMSLYPAFREGG